MTHVSSIDAAGLQQLIDTAVQPILIDFSATWCGPCKSLAPHLEAYAAETPGVHVVKIDIDESRELAQKFMVSAVPTLQVLVAGQVQATKTGALTKTQLADFVAQALA